VSVLYARGFFDLQLHFARTASVVSGMPFERALLQYTNFYIRFGLGRGFDPTHPGWQEYLAGLRAARDGGTWTHRFYVARGRNVMAPGIVASFGCFAYARLDAERIRLHFHNAETDGEPPLAITRREQRLADLAALFRHVERTKPGPLRVVGASWLYNIDAYRRLFPRTYLDTARVIRDRFQHLPLWGQFVDRRGQLRGDVAREFLARLGRPSSAGGLNECFPLPVLRLEAPVTDFLEFHGL
jgi:hypothetical protein